MTPPSAPAPRSRSRLHGRPPRRLALAAALALSACGINRDITVAPPGTTFVSIHDNAYQPDTVTVTVGKSVRWTNAGATQHTVAENTQRWASDPLQPGWWFEVRFDSTGTFDYHCTVHAETGTVIVQ
jgi:plastocyanin